jgi:hypothetical protein
LELLTRQIPPPSRFIIKIEIAERLAGRIADDERLRMLVDRPNVRLPR